MRHTVYPKQSVAAFLSLYMTGHSAPAFETKHVFTLLPTAKTANDDLESLYRATRDIGRAILMFYIYLLVNFSNLGRAVFKLFIVRNANYEQQLILYHCKFIC